MSSIRNAALTLLAGGPAVLGMWAGSLAYAPQWSALALAVGAGAMAGTAAPLQVAQAAPGQQAVEEHRGVVRHGDFRYRCCQ